MLDNYDIAFAILACVGMVAWFVWFAWKLNYTRRQERMKDSPEYKYWRQRQRVWAERWRAAGLCPGCGHAPHNQGDCIRCTCEHQMEAV